MVAIRLIRSLFPTPNDVWNETLRFPNKIMREELTNILNKNDSVLDVGAGFSCELKDFFNSLSINLTAIDRSTEFKARYLDSLEGTNFPVTTKLVDVAEEKLPFLDKAFHVVTGRFVLCDNEHESYEKIINEMLRVSKRFVLLIHHDIRNFYSIGAEGINGRILEILIEQHNRQYSPFGPQIIENICSTLDNKKYKVSVKIVINFDNPTNQLKAYLLMSSKRLNLGEKFIADIFKEKSFLIYPTPLQVVMIEKL